MSGTWHPLTNQPNFAASTMLLLTDGTVMCQQSGGVNWHRLSPDIHGNYAHGTFTALAPMHHTRLYYASAVLKDGRVFVAGGEYSNAGSETNTAEIYNPVLDTWTVISAPPGWAKIGDAPCAVLPDGRVLLGSIGDLKSAIYDPTTNSWTAGPNKNDRSSEETWVLLPDETVLTAECAAHPKAEKYVAAANTWTSAGVTPVDLVEASSIEIGPGILLPDGRAFFVGATGHTALYKPPPVANQVGAWTKGPDFPAGPRREKLGAKDAPGCLMPNGKVLCVAGPVDGVSGDYLSPTYFFEFDGHNLNPITAPPNSNGVPFAGRMVLVPSGQVLFAAGTQAIYVYSPAGAPEAAWRPEITGHPNVIRPLHTYTLEGRQLNGLSQAVGYGDDAAAATNYPIVRLRNIASGKVRYCRTFDHSSMGVATGTAIHSTNFAVPWGVETGATELVVIANGIASKAVDVNVQRFFWFNPFDAESVAVLIGSLADGPLWALGPNGPVPVDPMGPEVIKETKAIRESIVKAIRSLQAIGAKAAVERTAISERVAPAEDPDLTADGKVRKTKKKKALTA